MGVIARFQSQQSLQQLDWPHLLSSPVSDSNAGMLEVQPEHRHRHCAKSSGDASVVASQGQDLTSGRRSRPPLPEVIEPARGSTELGRHLLAQLLVLGANTLQDVAEDDAAAAVART